MSTNEMTSKIRELKELKAMAEELAQEITAIEDAIKAELTARNAEEMTVDVYKIRWTKVTSSRFDTTSFKKAMPELYGQFTKTSESRRFSIA
jgi:predicted phage-related endonuclease